MWTIVGILALAAIVFAWVEQRDRALKREAEKRIAEMEQGVSRAIATVEESSRLGTFGGICLALLILFLLLAGYAANNASTILQQMQADGVAIMSILLFGLGMVLSRRKTYTVYRLIRRKQLPPPVPAEPEKPLHFAAKLK